MSVVTIENEYCRYVIGAGGENLHFLDRLTGEDYYVQDPKSAFARVRVDGRDYRASAVSFEDGLLTVEFGGSGVSAVIRAAAQKHYLVLEVECVSGEGVEELIFVDLPLVLEGISQEPFAACALALNLRTRVDEIPGASSHLWAACYPRFGFVGARVALIGCPQGELRRVMQEAVTDAPELPHSPIGGPWALDALINQGSYLFNHGRNVTVETVDTWIALIRNLGFDQLDFHGGYSFRFGDCEPNPQMYPLRFASLKAVIDRLHEAGIAAGLHTYAFFMDKRCPWVTPVPDSRLGKDATFTLAQPLTSDATTIPVVEPTKDMSTITGFQVRNSVTVQIDNELITYGGVKKEPPYAFTDCKRGACGTRPAHHEPGASVYHLKECFGLFVPDGDSTLFTEVAARTAEAFNECGFDMIYLDALDGGDILAGPQKCWHYNSKFVFELWKRLKKPALMEMSTFHHHLWFVRSRIGAWDHPVRSYKKFIDIHCASNLQSRRMLLPAHLGWWSLLTWKDAHQEPTLPDDIEYLCCKCLGTDTGFSLMGIEPGNLSQVPALPRLAAIVKRYETLRRAGCVPDAIKSKLRAPGEEFTLARTPEGEWQFRPAQYSKHKVEGIDGWSNVWKSANKFERQPARVRIEALMSAHPYEAPGGVTVIGFSGAEVLPEGAAEDQVAAELRSSSARVKIGPVSGRYSALSTRSERRGAWAKVGRRFSPPLDLSDHQALGVWVHGDGRGEVLNFQLTSPKHVTGAIGDHYVVVDFTGWRYFELIEPEGERHADYSWPYGRHVCSIYRQSVDYSQVESISLWYNNLPPGEEVTCYLSPIKALPLGKAKFRSPVISVGGRRIVFPAGIESGDYLEFDSMSDCKLYGPKGELISEVHPEGEAPILEPGENEVEFACEAPPDVSPRARVTLITQGEALPIKWFYRDPEV